MDLIPHEEIRPSHSFNFAPMIDFLFLMLALFATLAISRATLYDSEVELTRLKPKSEELPLHTHPQIQQIHLTISAEGNYKWLTELQEYPMETIDAIQEELSRQYQIGVLPQDKKKTEILLHIDRRAPWESIAHLIFAIRELGFSIHPVYTASTEETS